ncbi:MAG TPA: hypothetical protein P5167_06360 [Bacteroidales bacterium]|nr:hypothetical protein [Bacteroidales bacterium]HRW95452.1 hypothetical protein [Bacteroidales bacterium]
MKKIVLFVILFAGLAACNNGADAPRLDLDVSKELKNNDELKEFVLTARDNANALARQCVKMHEEAQAFLDVNFDSLSTKEQEEIIKLDLDYVEMWYNFNIKHTSQTVQLMEYLKDSSIPKEEMVAMSKAMAAVNQFVQELKDTYGEDMKLDPHPAPVEL